MAACVADAPAEPNPFWLRQPTLCPSHESTALLAMGPFPFPMSSNAAPGRPRTAQEGRSSHSCTARWTLANDTQLPPNALSSAVTLPSNTSEFKLAG